MEELTRFVQLRPIQKLPDEYLNLVGLSLFPDGKLSELATKLKDAGCDKEKYFAALNRYKEKDGKSVISELHEIDSTILALYQWLDYKARPVKVKDFEAFLKTVAVDNKNHLEEWNLYADSFIIALLDNDLCKGIDFQLLIRVLHIFKLCITKSGNAWKLTATDSYLNELLTQPILLPKGALPCRCCCGNDHSKEQPQKRKLALSELKPRGGHEEKEVCECPCDTDCKQPSDHCLCLRTYVAELFIVKEELARYEEGDIAHIENILAGESKIRRHRNFYKTEDTTETENETIASEERDHQVAEKFSLQSEVKRTVDSKVNVDAGVTATLKYGEAVTLTPHANVTANFSKSESETVARSYAKDIVDRSVSKLQEKVRRVNISKVITELEERNKHSIDNTQAGADHRAGIYYWVNKVTHAQVFNYGKRMMFDVIVPEPASIFKDLYKRKLKADLENGIGKPYWKNIAVTPALIQRSNYGDILNHFMVSSSEECQPPNETAAIQVAFSQNFSEQDPNKTLGFSSHEFKSPEIPDGYMADTIHYDVRCSTGHPANTEPWDEVAVSVHVGKLCIFSKTMNEKQTGAEKNYNWSQNDWTPGVNSAKMNQEEGSLTIAVAGFSTLGLSLSGTVSITCKLKPSAFEKWQAKIYNLIMAEYNRKLAAYEAENDKGKQLIQIKGRNPFLNREIERNELKRHIIAILMCNYFRDIGSTFERVYPCGYPEIDFAHLEKDAPLIQFFEQVFEWHHVTYLFYHSMWARKCKWPELIDEDSGDALFDKFLMSGAARVQIPVRPGMEDVFHYFLCTGKIWGQQGIPPVPGEKEFVSMIQEIKEAKQGDYSDRPGLIEVTNGSDIVKLTESSYHANVLNVENDVDREILIDYEIYRIVKVEQAAPGDNTIWNITIDKLYPGINAKNLKYAVGAKFVGAPWEIVIPTKLVYLRNKADNKLPKYPLV